MKTYTEEQVDEIVQEAVAKVERSFGGTFKRLKSENEEFKTRTQAMLEACKKIYVMLDGVRFGAHLDGIKQAIKQAEAE